VEVVCARTNASFSFQLEDLAALIGALKPLRKVRSLSKGGAPDGNLNAARGVTFLVFDAYARLVRRGCLTIADACQEMGISRDTYNRRTAYQPARAAKENQRPDPADLQIRRRFLFDRYRHAMAIYQRAANSLGKQQPSGG
jgi:hypothetical protein